MSEASRLEHTVQNVVFEHFDLTQFLKNIALVYQDLYSQVVLEFTIPQQSIIINGSQELIAQMLDKLIANAVDFNLP